MWKSLLPGRTRCILLLHPLLQPRPELGRQRERMCGFWGHSEAGSIVALSSRSKSHEGERAACRDKTPGRERGRNTLTSLQPRPPTSCQCLPLVEPSWKPDVTGALQTQPARVATPGCRAGERHRADNKAKHRDYFYLRLHTKKQGTENLSNLPNITEQVERWRFEPRDSPDRKRPILTGSALAPSLEPLV